MDTEINSKIKENIRYSNEWWAFTTKFLSFFSYTENFHAETVYKLLKKMQLNRNILDIGFGSGNLLKRIKDENIVPIGIDISLKNITNLHNNNPYIYALPIDPFRSDLSFKSDCISNVVCSHVLEHVADDKRLIMELHRILTPEGIAVIMVPIHEENINDPNHVRKYTPESIQEILKPLFTIIEAGTNDILSYYIRYLGTRKRIWATLMKRFLILIGCLIPVNIAYAIDRNLITKLKIKKTSQIYILAKKKS